MRRKGQAIALVVLLVALAAVVYQWRQTVDLPGAPQAGAAAPGAGSSRRSAGSGSAVPAVRLDALEEARTQPPPPRSERNLFLFQPKAVPPPPPVAGRPGTLGVAGAAAGEPGVPPGPPPPPPIPFKFIGIVQAPSQKLAILADNSTKDVFFGREGDIIDGRYRILRIGVESVEMAYVDGRGRQTIRLAGS